MKIKGTLPECLYKDVQPGECFALNSYGECLRMKVEDWDGEPAHVILGTGIVSRKFNDVADILKVYKVDAELLITHKEGEE